MKKELLKQYAQLVAGVGINVQKGQTVVVRCPVDCADFGRALCAACFELGAKDVVMEWRDDVCSREHWLHADDNVFNGIPFVPQKLRNFPAILEHRKIQANPL